MLYEVITLPLGEEGVERERGLPRPRRPGDHGERAPGEVDVQVLEVVLTRITSYNVCYTKLLRDPLAEGFVVAASLA